MKDLFDFFSADRLPFDAYSYFVSRSDDFKIFTPTTMENDLDKGTISALAYYYHDYLPKLYELASEGKDYREFFRQYSPALEIYFKFMFRNSSGNLDRILERKLKKNHLDETIVRFK